MTKIKTFGVLTPMRHSVNVFVILVLVLIKPAFGQLKYSSKYNYKDLSQIVDEGRNNYNSYGNNEFVPSVREDDRAKVSYNLGKYISDFYNYIRQNHSFVESRKEVIPDYTKNQVVRNQNSYSNDKLWTKKVAECVEIKGLTNCLKIFLLRRVDRVFEQINESNDDRDVSIVFDDLIEEIRKDFKWEEYKNFTEKSIDALMVKKFQELVQKKRLKLVLRSGDVIDIQPHSAGTVRFDIQKETVTGRGMKWKKIAYRIVPIMMLPGLLFSGLLPFILPALKLMVIGTGILNQMALMGSIFTLLRNNIFDDKYEHKVVYLNDGYKNELHSEDYYVPHYPNNKKRKHQHKMRYPSLTTSGFDDAYEESKYAQFNDEFVRPQSMIDADGDVYAQDYHRFHNGGSYEEFDEVKRKEGDEFVEPIRVAAPVRRTSNKKTYSVRIRPHYSNGNNF